VQTCLRVLAVARLVTLVTGRQLLVAWLGCRPVLFNGACDRALAARSEERDDDENGLQPKPLHVYPHGTAKIGLPRAAGPTRVSQAGPALSAPIEVKNEVAQYR
jgi:hypothetical protein